MTDAKLIKVTPEEALIAYRYLYSQYASQARRNIDLWERSRTPHDGYDGDETFKEITECYAIIDKIRDSLDWAYAYAEKIRYLESAEKVGG